MRDKGIELLLEAIEHLEQLQPTPQPSQGTHAPMLQKDDGKIVWERSASEIYNRHRGVQPWPGSWFEHRGKRVKVLQMKRAGELGSSIRQAESSPAHTPGTVLHTTEGLTVATGEGPLILQEVQPEGKRPMSALDWARGAKVQPGDLLR